MSCLIGYLGMIHHLTLDISGRIIGLGWGLNLLILAAYI